MHRLPLFVWSVLITAFFIITFFTSSCSRNYDVCYQIEILILLFLILLVEVIQFYIQHLFRFLGHPEVYYINFTWIWYYKSCLLLLIQVRRFLVILVWSMPWFLLVFWVLLFGPITLYTVGMDVDTRAYFTAATMYYSNSYRY